MPDFPFTDLASETEVFTIHSKEVDKKDLSDELIYTIPDEQVLRVRTFSGGAEFSKKEVRTELLWRFEEVDQVIAVGYGSQFQFVVDRTFSGDGAIVIRHVNGDGALHMSAWWDGVLK